MDVEKTTQESQSSKSSDKQVCGSLFHETKTLQNIKFHVLRRNLYKKGGGVGKKETLLCTGKETTFLTKTLFMVTTKKSNFEIMLLKTSRFDRFHLMKNSWIFRMHDFHRFFKINSC